MCAQGSQIQANLTIYIFILNIFFLLFGRKKEPKNHLTNSLQTFSTLFRFRYILNL